MYKYILCILYLKGEIYNYILMYTLPVIPDATTQCLYVRMPLFTAWYTKKKNIILGISKLIKKNIFIL